MPRQTRRLPVDLSRFSYWALFPPMTAAEIRSVQRRRSARGWYVPKDPRSSRRPLPGDSFLRSRFLTHLQGACGDSHCAADARLADVVDHDQRVELAVEFYIRDSREWERDSDALKALSSLPDPAKGRLRRLAARCYGRRGHRTFKTLLEVIARDLRDFEAMVCARPAGKPRGIKRVVSSTDDGRYPNLKRVWTYYARQTLYINGRDPDDLTSAWSGRAATAGRQRSSLDLSSLSDDDIQTALHWFAHAYRTVVRYRAGRHALPFSPHCAARCRRAPTATAP